MATIVIPESERRYQHTHTGFLISLLLLSQKVFIYFKIVHFIAVFSNEIERCYQCQHTDITDHFREARNMVCV
jgi:hypothetical protein